MQAIQLAPIHSAATPSLRAAEIVGIIHHKCRSHFKDTIVRGVPSLSPNHPRHWKEL